MMDLRSELLARLDKVDSYLNQSYGVSRLYALGRVLEIESFAFSLRNGGLLTVQQFDEIDNAAEHIRNRHSLKAAYQ